MDLMVPVSSREFGCSDRRHQNGEDHLLTDKVNAISKIRSEISICLRVIQELGIHLRKSEYTKKIYTHEFT